MDPTQLHPREIERRFSSRLHEPRTAALLGIALGVTITICFMTGLLSHAAQHPTAWFGWPARPAGLYRVTQAVHTLTGVVTIPILLAKLWVVFPKLFEWPPVRSAAHGLERLSILPLIAGGLFMMLSGVANLARWYPWSFSFTSAHYAVAWITFGSLVIHLGTKWTIVRGSIGPATPADVDVALPGARRAFLGGVAATSGLAFLATAGNTISPLSKFAALAQRRPGVGPQGVPVNKSAKGAGVLDKIGDPAWTLEISGRVASTVRLSLADLSGMTQRSAVLPIACVEGWSSSATWTGVPIGDLLARAGVIGDAEVSVESVQEGGGYRRSDLNAGEVADPDTLLALRLNGQPLDLDHGYPMRLIGPNRPGVMQTKWVNRLVVR